MKKQDETTAEVGLGCIVAIISMVIGTFAKGYVLSVLWGWFVVPLFNLPQLSIPFALGISLIVSYMSYQSIETQKDEKTSFLTKIFVQFFTQIFQPAFVLLFGWIFYQFAK